MAEVPLAHPLSQAIYEGVMESPPWKTLLKYLEEFMHVPSATMVLRRPQLSDPGLTMYLYSDVDKRAVEDFHTKAYLDSPFAELPEKKVFTLYDRCTRSELTSLDFYEYLQTYNVSDLIGFDVVDQKSHMRLRLRLVRMGDAPGFSAQDRARLESMVPLMHKALALFSAYTNNSFVEEFYQELLGSMDIAAVILNAKLEVLSANSQAKQILSASDGVFLRHGLLRCSENADQHALDSACRALIKKSQEDEQTVYSASISIDRASADIKWDVHIRTVGKQHVVFGEGGPELVVLLQGPACHAQPSEVRLIDMFGVTPAEAKLIACLLDGLTLTAAAKALGVSRNTARTQLSSVFTKTGVNRQNQLIKLVTDTFAARWH